MEVPCIEVDCIFWEEIIYANVGLLQKRVKMWLVRNDFTNKAILKRVRFDTWVDIKGICVTVNFREETIFDNDIRWLLTRLECKLNNNFEDLRISKLFLKFDMYAIGVLGIKHPLTPVHFSQLLQQE